MSQMYIEILSTEESVHIHEHEPNWAKEEDRKKFLQFLKTIRNIAMFFDFDLHFPLCSVRKVTTENVAGKIGNLRLL